MKERKLSLRHKHTTTAHAPESKGVSNEAGQRQDSTVEDDCAGCRSVLERQQHQATVDEDADDDHDREQRAFSAVDELTRR